jgi:Bacterial Ig-like domain (group 1)
MGSRAMVRRQVVGLPLRVLTGVILAAATSACSSSAPAASTMVIVSGNGQSAPVGGSIGAPLVVLVTDQNGAPISGVVVTFDVPTGAVAGTQSATTDASGHASTALTLPTVSGTDTVTAWVQSILNPAIFTVTATAGPPAALIIVGGNHQTANAGLNLINQLQAQVLDQYANPLSGATVDWTTTAGSLTSPAQTTSDGSGLVAVSLQLPSTKSVLTATATLHGTAIIAVFTETAD